MATLRGMPLTPALVETAKKALDRVPADALLEVAHHIGGGFTKAEAVRLRFKEMIGGQGALPEWLEALLLDQLSPPGLSGMFDGRALKDFGELFSLVLGHEAFVLALLGDQRPEVQQLARKVLDQPPISATPEDKQAAAATLFSLQFPLWSPLTKILSERVQNKTDQPDLLPLGTTPGSSTLPSAAVLDPNEVERLKGYLDDEKRRSKEALKRQKTEFESKIQDLQSKLASMKALLESAETEKNKLSNELAGRQLESEKTIVREIDTRTTALQKPWLRSAIDMERAGKEAAAIAGDLVAQANAFVDLQAKHDKQFGDKREFERRLSELAAARANIATALSSSLHPIAKGQ